ncbi:MAG: acyloxyacyl hydrolase [Candidatus Omnitrophica bacterium]|nr:acyloxyacyl hydrolase [Candidatus Omnitrophota bacterium]
MKIPKIWLAVLFFLLLDFLPVGLRKAFCFQRPESLKEIGIFTGTGKASLKEKDDYEIIPLGARFGFDIKPLIEKVKIKDKSLKIKGRIDFLVEPYLAGLTSPEANFECGTGLLLRYSYKVERFLPFIEVGTGLQWTSQHTREEGTQWCFQLQGGSGFYYFFKRDKAINFSYRFRHFSNRDIKEPNTGIDVHAFLIGVSTFF